MRTRPPRSKRRQLAGAWGFLGILGVLGLGSTPARAVVSYGGTGQFLVPSSGPVTTEGFQYEGQWQNNFLGTAIAPNYFITANHLGGNVGDSFSYQGTNYTTTAVFTDPSSPDVAIWKVNGTFSQYAPIYTGGNEVGQNLVVYGESGARGTQVNVDGTAYGGWNFTGLSTSVSYGTNVVTFTGPITGALVAQYLAFQFNPALGATTASLAPGDSGGGVFIQQNGVWSLAGINYAVDGPYNIHAATDPNYKASDAFNAAMYDTTGLFFDGELTPLSGPASSYASRLSTEAAWIAGVTAAVVPEPSSFVILLGGLAIGGPLLGRSRLKRRST